MFGEKHRGLGQFRVNVKTIKHYLRAFILLFKTEKIVPVLSVVEEKEL